MNHEAYILRLQLETALAFRVDTDTIFDFRFLLILVPSILLLDALPASRVRSSLPTPFKPLPQDLQLCIAMLTTSAPFLQPLLGKVTHINKRLRIRSSIRIKQVLTMRHTTRIQQPRPTSVVGQRDELRRDSRSRIELGDGEDDARRADEVRRRQPVSRPHLVLRHRRRPGIQLAPGGECVGGPRSGREEPAWCDVVGFQGEVGALVSGGR